MPTLDGQPGSHAFRRIRLGYSSPRSIASRKLPDRRLTLLRAGRCSPDRGTANQSITVTSDNMTPVENQATHRGKAWLSCAREIPASCVRAGLTLS
jgi:hypothetical protein